MSSVTVLLSYLISLADCISVINVKAGFYSCRLSWSSFLLFRIIIFILDYSADSPWMHWLFLLQIHSSDITGVGGWKHSLSSSIFSLILHFTTRSNLLWHRLLLVLYSRHRNVPSYIWSGVFFYLEGHFLPHAHIYRALWRLSTCGQHNRVWVQEQGRRSLEWKHVLPAQFAKMIFEWPLKMLFEPQECCLYMKGHRAFCWDKQQLYEGWCSKTEKSLQVNNILSGRQGAKPSSSDGWKQVDSQKDRFSELSDEFGWTSRPQSVSWFTRFKKSYCWRFPFNPQSCIQSLCLRLSFREPKKEGRHQTGFQTVLTKPNISTSYDFW